CMGILRLGKTFGNDRLEAACLRALSISAFSYKSVKSILNSGLDQRPLPEKPHQLVVVHSNIRGAIAYAPSTDKENNNDDPSNDRQHAEFEALWNGPGPGDSTGTEGCPRT